MFKHIVNDALAVVLFIGVYTSLTRAAPRPVNISNTWVLPEAGFPVFYRYFRDRISWYEADAVCQFHHGNLVTVDTTSQFDAVRSYLKELNIISNVWIGLTRANENADFSWANSKSLTGDGYWREAAPTVSTPLCAASDPSADFRWHALGCGGPEVASFICELPVPPWATGAEGCLLPLKGLTVIYLPEQTALELTADCGLEGTRRIACKGKADQTEMTGLLTCPQEKNSIPKTVSSTPYSTNAIKSATKPWIWTSNTIDTGEYGSPTRHRRETEDMLSTAGGFPVTKESSTTTPLDNKTTKKQMEKIETTTTKAKMSEIKTNMKTVKVDSTTETVTTEENGEYASINQGQLFSLIENGTVFDIIEVNDTASDLIKDKNTKIIDETTTKVTLTSNVNLKKEITKNEKTKVTDSPVTTVSYYKEAPPTKTTVTSIVKQPTVETNKQKIEASKAPIKETTVQQPILTTMETKLNKTKDLSNNEQDKTFIKEIENSAGNALIKLNRTSRKELPMIDFNFTSEEKNEIAEEKNVSKEDEHDHRVVEITLMHDDKKKEGAKLYVTTKKHDKLKVRKNEKLIDSKSKNSLTNDKLKPKIKEEMKVPSEVHELLNATESTLKVIDPKLVDLNFNTTKNIQSERIPIKLQQATLEQQQKIEQTSQKPEQTPKTTINITPTSTDEIKEITDYETNEFAEDTSDSPGLKTTEEPFEPIPEAQPRPNRNRVLTRPQRRSFYPYFFSRVLG